MENKAEHGEAPAEGAKKPGVCSVDSFEKKKAGWRKLIVEGKKTVADLVSMIETKEILSAEQKLEIDAWSHEND